MPVLRMAEQHVSKATPVVMDYSTFKVSEGTGDRKSGE